MGLKLITPPANGPISLDDAKAHLRVDFADDDDMIQALIAAAADYSEGFLGRALVDQTWELTLDRFSGHGRHSHHTSRHEIKIPKPPLIDVTSIKYDDPSGIEQTLDMSLYSVDAVSEPGWVLPVGSWPATFDGINAVRIRFRCGYLDLGSSPALDIVPPVIKAAIKLIVGNLYANRETIIIGQTVAEIPMSAERLLRCKRFDLGIA